MQMLTLLRVRHLISPGWLEELQYFPLRFKGSQNGNLRCVTAVWQPQLQSAETMIHSFMAEQSSQSLCIYLSLLSPLKESMSVIQLHQSVWIRK